MREQKSLNPEQVLEALLKAAARQQKAENLRKLNKICSAQHTTTKDFSFPVIGKLWEAAGGIQARALYNKPSEDYRTLIKAWEAWSGPTPKKKPEQRERDSDAYLKRIEDPAIRALVNAVIIERDKYRNELQLLKQHTRFHIDLRPTVLPSPPKIESDFGSARATMALELTTTERDALVRAISVDFLSDEGWQEGPSGEILNDKGRLIFDIGFTKAIRKVLEKSRK